MGFDQRNILVALLLISLMSCSGSSRWNREFDWRDEGLERLPGPHDFPDAGAVILLDEGELEIFRGGGFAFSDLRRHRIIKIFNKRGYNLANISIPFSNSTTIDDLKARTITPDGAIIPLRPEQVYETNLYPHFIFYSDVKAKRFTLPAIQDGCIIEYEWRSRVRNFTYWDIWPLQNSEPTLLSRYKVLSPSEWELKWKSQGIKVEPQVTKVPSGFKQEYLWQARDVPALSFEPAMPPLNQVRAAILFSPIGMNTWRDVGNWYRDLIRDRITATEAIRQKTLSLTRDCAAELEKLERIYRFVRDEIRYIAISIGIGGYQPHFAKDILHNRYGDCKDKVTLMMAMASVVDVALEPVLISTFYNGEVDTSIASHIHFNHVIAHARLKNGRSLWLDATEENCPFGELPWYDQDRLVLMVPKDLEELAWIRTPQQGPKDNVFVRIWTLESTAPEAWHGTVQISFTGGFALNTRNEIALLNQDEAEEWLMSSVVRRFPGAILQTCLFENTSRLTDTLRITASFTWQTSQALSLANTLIPAVLSQFDWQRLFSMEKRVHPILLHYPSETLDSLRIVFPSDQEVIMESRSELIPTPFGRLFFRISKHGPRELGFCRTLTVTRTQIGVHDYKDFTKFINSISLADRTPLFEIRR